MTRLTALQANFQAHVLSGTSPPAEQFVGTHAAAADERLGVYATAYRLRLLEALSVDYPGVAAIVKPEEFRDMGLRYIDRYPSKHPSIRWFGQHLAQFLADDQQFSHRLYLSELARFEWARGLAFDARSSTIVALDELAHVAPESWGELRLQMSASLQRGRSGWNIGPIWRAVDAGKRPPVPAPLTASADWAIWRRNLTLYWRFIEPAEAAALDAFMQGESFSGVCDLLCNWMVGEEVPGRAAGMLQQWLTEGLVAALMNSDP